MKITGTALATLAITAAALPPPHHQKTPTYFFTFGDSYSQTGFNVSLEQPSTANPMGNPSIGEGTTTGGLNWIEYLTVKYNKTLVFNYDLAVGGAVIDNNIVANPGYPYDLVSQVSLFHKTYASKPESARWTADTSVFGIWIGINDCGNAYFLSDTQNITTQLLTTYGSLVDDLYSYGARRFLFLNVPPTSRSPLFESQGNAIVQEQAAFVDNFNTGIKDMTTDFERKHRDATVVLYDDWSFMTKVLNNPTAYGYANASAASCYDPDGSTCVWWNNYHPGYVYHNAQVKDTLPHLAPLGSAWGPW